ncbi:MAG: hypothetical protein ACFFG0_30230 [Candidatus Thorarchaeota archaeon]
MMRKHIALLCFGLIFIVSSNIFLVFVIPDIKSHSSVNINTTLIHQAPSIDEYTSNQDINIIPINHTSSIDEYPSNQDINIIPINQTSSIDEYPSNQDIQIIPIDPSPSMDEEHNIRGITIATIVEPPIIELIVEPTILELIDDLIEGVLNSPDECWQKPASNRINTIINKLNTLKDIVFLNNFESAYDKLLHEIKPKLTGKKTDENEEEWGNGINKKPWVICDDHNLYYQEVCNEILSLLKNGSQPA